MDEIRGPERQGIASSKFVSLALLPAVIVPTLLVLSKESIWPAILAYHALCVVAPLTFRCSLKEAGLGRSQMRRWLPLTMMLSVFLLRTGVVGSQVFLAKTLLPEGWKQVLGRIRPWWAFVAYSVLVNALCEECFWRGFLLPKTGIVGGAAFFWLMHAAAASVFLDLLAAVWFTLPALVAGLMWGWMRRRFETLWPSLITHLATDMAILWVGSGLLQLSTSR